MASHELDERGDHMRLAVIGLLAAVAIGAVRMQDMPDFTKAGYHSGQAPIPDVKVVADVTKFGAKGDGQTDDTAAFRAAVASVKGVGAINIPQGRYVITGIITLDHDGVVLRGAGAGKSVLYVPKSLQDIAGDSTVEETKSGWAFSGGFIEIRGKQGGDRVSALSADATRGDRKLVLETVGSIKPGDWIRILTNNDASLGRYLHGGKPAGTDTFRYKNFINWVARVDAVDGKTLTLDRPLRVDLKKPWQPEVWTYRPGVQEIGVEDLTFEFLGRKKKEHLKEEGFNAIYFDGADNCWIKGCEFIDADNSINVTRARFVTVQDVKFRAAKRTSPSGHHAMWSRASQDCFFHDFTFETEYVHDLSVEGFASGNVFENGKGVAICLDHHGDGPYENLFTNIDLGDAGRLWVCGGSADRLPHSAERTVIWNLRYEKGKVPKLPDWPGMIVVGVKGYTKGTPDQLIDDTAPVPDLYQAQTKP